MNWKRIIGVVLVIGGIASLLVAGYIRKQVAEGKLEISSAQSKVNQGKTLFGLTPYTKDVGDKVIFDPAQKKIRAGQSEVAHYEILASRLQIGGVILIVAGIIVFFLPMRKWGN